MPGPLEPHQAAIIEFIEYGQVPEEQRLLKALTSDDDLGAVIRTQTFIESYVEKLLRRYFIDRAAGDAIKVRRIAYDIRLQLLRAFCELDEGLKVSLNLLAGIRNSFAHNPLMEMDIERHQGFIRSLSGDARFVFQFNMEFSYSDANSPSAFGHLSVQQRELRAALDALRTVVSMILKRGLNKPADSDQSDPESN